MKQTNFDHLNLNSQTFGQKLLHNLGFLKHFKTFRGKNKITSRMRRCHIMYEKNQGLII